jgi:hypothetical protein
LLLVCSNIEIIKSQSMCCDYQPSIFEGIQQIVNAMGGGSTPVDLGAFTYWMSLFTRQSGSALYALESATNKSIAQLSSEILSQTKTANYFASWHTEQLGRTLYAIDEEIILVNKTLADIVVQLKGYLKYYGSYHATQIGNTFWGPYPVTNSSIFTVATQISYDMASTKNNALATKDQVQYYGSYQSAQTGNTFWGTTAVTSTNVSLWTLSEYITANILSKTTDIDTTLSSIDVSVKDILSQMGGEPIPSKTISSPASCTWSFATGVTTSLSPVFCKVPAAATGKKFIYGVDSMKLGLVTSTFGFMLQAVTYSLTESFGRFSPCGSSTCNIQNLYDAEVSHGDASYVSDNYRNWVSTGPDIYFQNPADGGDPWLEVRSFYGVNPDSIPQNNEANCAPGELSMYFTIIPQNNAHTNLFDNRFELLFQTWIGVGPNNDKHITSTVKIASGEVSVIPGTPKKYSCNGALKDSYLGSGNNCFMSLCVNPSQAFAPSTLLKKWIFTAGESKRLAILPSQSTSSPNAGRQLIKIPSGQPILGKLIPTVGSQSTGQPGLSTGSVAFKRMKLKTYICSGTDLVAKGNVLITSNIDTNLEGLLLSRRSPSFTYYYEWLETEFDQNYAPFANENYWPDTTFHPTLLSFKIMTELDDAICDTVVGQEMIPQTFWGLQLEFIIPTV